VDVLPEKINLEKNLDRLNITKDQFIDIALCTGTDFNKGIQRVGAKTALKLIKEYGDFKGILEAKGLTEDIPRFEAAKSFFKNPPVTSNYSIKWERPDKEEMTDFLCRKHDFSESRVSNVWQKINTAFETKKKTTLDQWF
jgi:flap endonuclease-1